MGRLAVRQAIQSSLQSAGIPYVGTVYVARPTILPESSYEETMAGQVIQASANGSACVIVVTLPGPDRRTLRSLAGRGNVDDTSIHAVVLEVWFASTSGDAIAAQTDYDTIVDKLFELIRNDPVFAAPQTIWSAAEDTPGVWHNQGLPVTSEDGLTILIAGEVRFNAWEWIAGTGV